MRIESAIIGQHRKVFEISLVGRSVSLRPFTEMDLHSDSESTG